MWKDSFAKIKNLLKSKEVLLIIVPVLIALVLFRGRNLLGGGESGVPFYSVKRMLEISESAWSDSLLGINIGLATGNIPFFAFFRALEILHFPGYVLQASFFFVLFALAPISMYLLARELFPQKNRVAWLFSGFFYLANLYSILNIWNRFLLNFMLFYSFLPLGLMVFVRGLKRRSYFWGIFLAVLSVLFSYAFTAPAHNLIFWFLILAIALHYFLFVKRDVFVLKYLLVVGITWFILNFWWVSQELYFLISPAFTTVSEAFFSPTENQLTFNALSHELGRISNLLLLKHGTFFTQQQGAYRNWPLIYNHPASLVLMWLFTGLTLFIALKKLRKTWVKFFAALFIIGLFLAKGNSPPLGEIFDFLFRRITILHFFRNPFEKLGVILSLSFSMLFGLAIFELWKISKGRRRLNIFIKVVSLFYVFIFLGFPFWTGLIFTGRVKYTNEPKGGYQVEVPSYYKNADNWLSSNEGIFRFISFPLGGEGIFYKWSKGYVGIEQSGVLFSVPSISYNTTVPHYNSIVGKLQSLFLERDDFYKIASLLNVRFLMLRPDLDFKLSGMKDPKIIENFLVKQSKNPNTNLTFANEFGPIKLYEFSGDFFLPKVYPSSTAILSNQLYNLEDFYLGQGQIGDILISSDFNKEVLNNYINEKSSVYHPFTSFFFAESARLPTSIDPSILPHVSHIAGEKIYPLVLLRENLRVFFLANEKETEFRISLLGKRLVEAQKSVDLEDLISARKSLELYKKQLSGTIKAIERIPLNKTAGETVWRKKFLLEAFGTQILLLSELKEKKAMSEVLRSTVQAIENDLRSNLQKIHVMSIYELREEKNFPINDRQVYQFEIKESGEYELMFPEKDWDKYYIIKDKVAIQLDDRIIESPLGLTSDNYISFGKHYLESGIHEMGINVPEAINLIDSEKEFKLEAFDEEKRLNFDVKNFNSAFFYHVSFDYYTRFGELPKVEFVQDIDPVINKKLRPIFRREITSEGYWFDYQSYKEGINPNQAASSAYLVLSVKPWNDCKRILDFNPKSCEDLSFRRNFNRKSETIIKNLGLKRFGFRDPVLRKVDVEPVGQDLPEIKFSRLHKTKYLVTVKNVTDPFVLVFSELFDDGWRAYLKKGDSTSLINGEKHILVNGYANAWLIDGQGDYQIILEFWPQRLLKYASIISLIGIFLSVSYLIKSRKKNLGR